VNCHIGENKEYMKLAAAEWKKHKAKLGLDTSGKKKAPAKKAPAKKAPAKKAPAKKAPAKKKAKEESEEEDE